jgi:hypothetical protein
LFSRFWTRNRPGDTVIDKTDELTSSAPKQHTTYGGHVGGIIFKEMPDYDKQRGDGSFFLPGLDLDNNNLMEEAEENEGLFNKNLN